jgi:lactoylglutathione lyase
MRLNHLNLTVPDVSQTRDFFEKYFAFHPLLDRPNFAVLADEKGFVLTLNNFGKDSQVSYPKAFHVGFMQGSREQVDEFYHRLKSDGYDTPAPREFHGAWTFYFTAPGGFQIEILHQQGAPAQE